MARVPRDGFPHALDRLYDYLDDSLDAFVGNRYYVDPSSGVGDDSNTGLSKTFPLATMQAAIDKCTANNGDVIVRMAGTETVSEPVDFNKRGITVIAQEYGHPSHVKGESFMTYNNQSDGGSAAIITEPCRLIGLGFAASDVSEEALLIDCEEAGGFSGGFIELRNCRFACWNGAIDALVRTVGGALNHIIDCEFDGVFVGVGTAAISMEGDTGGITPFYPRVIGCRFMALGSGKAAIEHKDAAAAEVVYMDNVLGSEGVFLDNSDLASDGIAANNWLGLANQAAAFTNMTNSNIKLVGNHYNE